MHMKNYYEILEVNKRASTEVIEKAYRVLVRKYHPDLYTGEKQIYAERKIKEINEAYHVLSDQFLREQYDGELEKEERNRYEEMYHRTPSFNKTQERKQNKTTNENKEKVEKPVKVGTLFSLIDLTKELFTSRKKRKEVKEVTQKDIVAIVLTIVITILIGVVLWFIPFTNGWMRELLFENPLFNWIGGLFS